MVVSGFQSSHCFELIPAATAELSARNTRQPLEPDVQKGSNQVGGADEILLEPVCVCVCVCVRCAF